MKKRCILALCILSGCILIPHTVNADSDGRQWQPIASWHGSFSNTSSASTPVLTPIQTIDEVQKPNQSPLDEQLEILEIFSFLYTILVSICTWFLIFFMVTKGSNKIIYD